MPDTTANPNGSPISKVEVGLLSLMVLLFALHALVQLYHAVGGLPLPERVPWALIVPLYASFALVSSLLTIGWKRTLTFFGLACVISYLMELLGEQTGVIFGRYEYTDVLAPKLGPVPLVVPLAYYMLVYPAFVMTNVILTGSPTAATRPLHRRALVAILPALIMTGFDLAYDPLMASGYRAWIWLDGGPYFGVPLQNFLGWFLTSYLVALACGLAEPVVSQKPLAGRDRRWVTLLAIASFAALMVGVIFAGYPEGTRVVAPFTMGVPLVAALFRLYP